MVGGVGGQLRVACLSPERDTLTKDKKKKKEGKGDSLSGAYF